MKIVVLDARPLDDGDLDWSPLEALGEVTRFERTRPDEVAERIAGAEAVLTNKCRLSRETIEGAPRLRYIGELATGTDNIAVTAARERGIVVANVRGYSGDFTAQMTWALLLELCARVGDHSRLVFEGEWSRCPDFSFWRFPLVELAGKTLVVVGVGNIGGRVARIGQAFGMNVLAAQLPGRESAHDDFRRVPLDEALGLADVVSLHCPLNDATRGVMNAQRLEKMKRGALLVNTGRGPLVDEGAVQAALETGHLGGYAADVLSWEPPPSDHPLLGTRNCLLTPHLSWASPEARQRLWRESVENLAAWRRGEARNRVS